AACGMAPAPQPAVAETIALDLTGPRPTAQLRVNGGAPATAIFDTGAAGTILRLDYATRSALPNNGNANAHCPGGALIPGFQTTMEQGQLAAALSTGAFRVPPAIPLSLPGIDAIVTPSVFAGRLVKFVFPAGRVDVVPKTAANTPTAQADDYLGQDTHGQLRR